MKRSIYCLAALLVATSCVSKKEGSDTPEESNAIKVHTEAVRTVTGNTTLHYSGSIEPSQTVPLTFQASGTVLQVLVNAGDAVRKGQLLATIDKADAQSMYQMTNAKYQQAQDAYNRLKEVHDNGSLPEIKWVEMESNLQQAKSSAAIAKNNLNKCNLYAPQSGIIGSRNIEPGMSSLGNPVAPLTLIQIESVYVKIAVPENEISKIKKGMTSTFKVAALDNQCFEGKVSNVGVVADPISKTYEVKILVRNPGLALKPGMVCDVNLGIAGSKETLAVSYKAVDKDLENNSFVYVVDTVKNTVHRRIIQTGDYQNDCIEVHAGLSLGEKVVTDGKQKMSDHCKISL
jgi:RND family efflux transporter MFP subunit